MDIDKDNEQHSPIQTEYGDQLKEILNAVETTSGMVDRYGITSVTSAVGLVLIVLSFLMGISVFGNEIPLSVSPETVFLGGAGLVVLGLGSRIYERVISGRQDLERTKIALDGKIQNLRIREEGEAKRLEQETKQMEIESNERIERDRIANRPTEDVSQNKDNERPL